MRLTKLESALTAVIVVTVATVAIILWRQAKPATNSGTDGSLVAGRRARASERTGRSAETRPDHRSDTAVERDPSRASSPAREPASGEATPQAQTRDEKAVAEWAQVVDRAIAETNAPIEDRAQQVKKAFDKIADEAREENIRRLLNLTPDDQFGLVDGILFDKTYSTNVLDAIFSDALNRPEGVKVPIMKKLVLDKTHPMFFESARILDITGALDKSVTPPATPP